MSNTAVFPEYFKQKWLEKEKCDLAGVDAKAKFARKAQLALMVLLPALFVSMAIVAFRDLGMGSDMTRTVASYMLILVFPLMLLIPALDYRMRSLKQQTEVFQRNLTQVSLYLGRDVNDLTSLKPEALTALAVSRLKNMASYIQKVQVIEGADATVTKEFLLERFDNFHESFVRWDLVSDVGWGKYFSI